MHRRFFAAGLCALAATGLTACGGDDDISSKSAQEVLKETFGPDKPIKSGRVDLSLAFKSTGLQGVDGPVAITLKGPFSSPGAEQLPSFDLDVALSAGGQNLSAGAVSTSNKGFVKFSGQNFAIPDDLFKQFKTLYEKDQKEAKKKERTTFSALGVDPTRWLKDPKKVGDEEVGGATTVHVSAKVNVPAFLDDVNKLLGRAQSSGAAAAAGQAVPGELTAEQRKQIESAIKDTSLDVFAGKEDGTLRRIALNIDFDVPAESQKAAGGLKNGSLGINLTIGELNEEQTIKAPTGARPLAELTGGAATGATGAAGATPAPAPAPTDDAAGGAAAGGANQKYLTCLDSAGTDIAKAQECAPLLNGG